MAELKRIGVGAGVGLALGVVALLGARTLAMATAAAVCPTGWTEKPSTDANLLRQCVAPRRESGLEPRLALFQGESAADGALAGLVAQALAKPATLRPADPIASDGFGVRTFEATLPPQELHVQLYLISGGRRFGLLKIVHAPSATFAKPENTARWMSTFGGTAPWGAPSPPALTARCPDGFQTLPGQGERSVVRCIGGADSSEFALIDMSWDEGGMGRDEDRATMATSLSQRMAGPAGTARVLTPTGPFTLCPTVDAYRTEVGTSETTELLLEAYVMTPTVRPPNLQAVLIGEGDAVPDPVLSDWLKASGAGRPLPFVVRPVGMALGLALCGLLGALAGKMSQTGPRASVE